MKDELIKVIAEYLDSKTEFRADFIDGKNKSQVYFSNAVCSTEFLAEIAAEIAGKVLEIVEQKTGWEDAPSWATWLASNNAGLSQWFEDKPIWDDDIQMWDASTEDGRYKFAGKLAKGKELLQRPKWDYEKVC